MSDWYQPSLLMVEVIEVHIRLGVIPERDHTQVMVELLDPTTGILISQWARPHGSLHAWGAMLDEAVDKAKQTLGDAVDPF